MMIWYTVFCLFFQAFFLIRIVYERKITESDPMNLSTAHKSLKMKLVIFFLTFN